MSHFFLTASHFTLLALLLLGTPLCHGVNVTNIRLRNGQTTVVREGRIEIQVNGVNQWGSICDDGWGNTDAIVACRMLGYRNGGTAVTTDVYGTGNFLFLMDDSACTGDEETLTQCISSQSSDCTRDSDFEAGVVCNENLAPGVTTPRPITTTTEPSSIISGNCQQNNPTVRLFGKTGVDGMGFVEVQDPNGQWGFVCDDGWNEAAAIIVCAQLCFPTNYTAKPGIPAEHKVNPSNPQIILDNVKCVGTEATIQDCPNGGWNNNDCQSGSGELAGVQCVEAEFKPRPAPVPILTCGDGLLIAQFSRADDENLEEKHLSVFNDSACPDVSKDTTNDFVSITIPVEKCGTTIARNGTHILYYNQVKYDYTLQEGVITRTNAYRVQITCALPVGKEVTQRVQPLTESVTQKATGNFQTAMLIFRSDSFDTAVTDNPVQIPLGEWLNMAVTLEEYDSRLKLVVTDCVTTPTGDKNGNPKKFLFQNKCSQESTLSFYPISNFKYGFRFKPFKFVGYDLLYIHCDAIVCLEADNTQECDRTCNNTKPTVAAPTSTVATTSAAPAGRRKRSAGVFRTVVDSPAIILYDPYGPKKDFIEKQEEGVKVVIGVNDPTMKPNLGVSQTLIQNGPSTTISPLPQQSEIPTSTLLSGINTTVASNEKVIEDSNKQGVEEVNETDKDKDSVASNEKVIEGSNKQGVEEVNENDKDEGKEKLVSGNGELLTDGNTGPILSYSLLHLIGWMLVMALLF